MKIGLFIKRTAFVLYLTGVVSIAACVLGLVLLLIALRNPILFSGVKFSISSFPHLLKPSKHPLIVATMETVVLLTLCGVMITFFVASALAGWRKLTERNIQQE